MPLVRNDTILFTAKMQGQRTVQQWITPQQAKRKVDVYQSKGWHVRCQTCDPETHQLSDYYTSLDQVEREHE